MTDYTGTAIYESFVFVDHRNIVDYITQGGSRALVWRKLI